MNYTSNYNLKLPERNEQFNIDDWNSNTMAIDSQMKTNATNIASNTTNIATIFTGLNTKNVSNTDSVYYKLMKLIYPVGSIYWSSNSANPSTLFGGTWTQIKDKFVWAKGDSDTVNATGGAKTVTLTVNNLPSHNHSFTPRGSVSVTTNPTFSGSAVTSGESSSANTGNESSHTHTINNGNTSSAGTTQTAGIRHSGNTGGMSAHSTGWFANQGLKITNGEESLTDGSTFTPYQSTLNKRNYAETQSGNKNNGYQLNIAHTHTLPAFYIYGKTDAGTSHSHSMAHTHSVTASGTISGGAYSFNGTAGTTGNTGSGTAVDKMPPYVVKYCWERTA